MGDPVSGEVEVVGLRTQRSKTYATGRAVAAGFEEFRAVFCGGPIWLPDLRTPVDLGASRLSGLDTVFDKLAGGAAVRFEYGEPSYILSRGGKEMRYEYAGTKTWALTGIVGNVVTYLSSDGVEVKFHVQRTTVRQISRITRGVPSIWNLWRGEEVPTFRRVQDDPEAFGMHAPSIYSDDMMRALRTGQLMFDATGRIAPLDMGGLTLPVRVDPTSTFNPGAGDGQMAYAVNAAWATVYGAADATAVSSTAGQVVAVRHPSTQYMIYRCRYPFDVSSIPAGSTVSAASFRGYVTYIENHEGANFTIDIVQDTQTSLTNLVVGDYSKLNAVLGASQLADDLTLNANNTWTLNATALTWITPGGSALLGTRAGFDRTNTAPPTEVLGGQYNDVEITSSEGANPPVLSVTYAAAATGRRSPRAEMLLLGLP